MGLKVLVVEDSMVFQKIIATVLRDMPDVADVKVAGTGKDALQVVADASPDLVFLDLHLPDMDGLAVLDELKSRGARARVVVVSGLSVEGADLTIQALSRGAQQFIRKPSGAGFQQSVTELKEELAPVIKSVNLSMRTGAAAPRPFPARAAAPTPRPSPPVPRVPQPVPGPRPLAGRPGQGVPPARTRPGMPVRSTVKDIWVTAIAVSTGGPQALGEVIPRLPASYPTPIVVVQHMPPMFTESLAKSLDAKSAVKVVEAKAGMELQAGTVYIAPGGKHMVVRQEGGLPRIFLNQDPPEQSVRPAADVLFRSLAQCKNGRGVLAVVLTGMGEDGLAGVRALKPTGCHCLTQTESTCVVYGMPRAVDLAGLSDESADLQDVADRMVRLTTQSGAGVRV